MQRSPATPAFALPWLALVLAGPVAAQIEPSRIYTGGEQISDPESGLRLTLPGGWHGRLSPDGESFMLEPEAGGALIVVLADEMTEADARAQMAEPFDLGDGIVLTPGGPVQDVASGHVSASYSVSGSESPLAGTVDVRITQTGLGVAFILLSPPDAAQGHEESMRELAFSLGVEEPTAQTGANDEWQAYLRGMYLARYYTGTGYTESTEIWLCSNGVFYYDSQGGGFGGGASGAAQSTGGGQWSATGAGAAGTLILQWGNGERSTMALSFDYGEDRLYVDGDRYLRANNERCG
jgi:hypothetical protein